MTKVFFDTNILVYASDRRDRRKQAIAAKLVADGIRRHNAVVSTQVLQEYASVALSKLSQSVNFIDRRLLQFESLEIVQLTPPLIRRALDLHSLHQIHYWDAAIVAAAEAARCTLLWSEDFPVGATYGLIRVENPLAQ